jgi:hypothetical protein
MKVIAKVDSTRVLCEVSIEELAFLNGFRSSYADGFSKDRASEVGAECNLNKMVATSRFVRGVRTETLAATKQKLEDAIKSLDGAMDTISSLEIFNILNEEKQIGE